MEAVKYMSAEDLYALLNESGFPEYILSCCNGAARLQ